MPHETPDPAAARRFRRATAEDAARDGHRFTWLKPDGWRPGGVSLVLENPDGPAGRSVIGVGRAVPNAVHPGRDLVEVEVDEAHRRRGHGTALIHELGTYMRNPLSTKAEQDTERHAFLMSLGAYPYQVLPYLVVDLQHPGVGDWCAQIRAEHAGPEEDRTGDSSPGTRRDQASTAGDGGTAGEASPAVVRPWTAVDREQLIEAMTDRYAWQHASWSPTAPREVLRQEVGADFVARTHENGSFVVERGSRITAIADLYEAPVPGTRAEAAVEAVDPAAPWARADTALVLGALLEHLREQRVAEVDLDNHPTDPHAAPLLATLPRIETGTMDLLEIPTGLTGRLRELGLGR
ncbi:GNAT family N-acetyltransferase [Brachybacterium hainanense]|uniref:GNAT family N-acetyltransferase n=1 Tax=Brachybacterium hainanense TaxID=1541174 RepID=A0ABV6R9V2_9MICO